MSTTLGPPPGDRSRRADRGDQPRLLLPALLGVLASILVVLVLLATGVLSTGGSTRTIVQSPGTGAGSATTGAGGDAASTVGSFDAARLYVSAAPSVVDVVAETTQQVPVPFGEPHTRRATSTGTGFVVDRRGRIVTAQHVVAGSDEIRVTFIDGSEREATLLGQDDSTDVAVLQVVPRGLDLQPLRLGRSSGLQVGDPVAAIGAPFSFSGSLSSGVVSGLDRTIEAPNGFSVAHAIQTDAALNPGNSGGPLLAADGSVVGMVDQIATSAAVQQSSGVGFAVPSEILAGQLDTLIAGRTVEHAYAGISTSSAADGQVGALVADVVDDGPAARAGIRPGDVITRLDDEPISGSGELIAVVADHDPGDQLEVTLQRGADTVTRTLTLGTQPSEPR